jgi:hypothetical protein
LLIPVNGFDAAGHRIGYGGGYFDRTLASLSPRPLAVGVGFELARLDLDPPRAARPAARRDGHRSRNLRSPRQAPQCLRSAQWPHDWCAAQGEVFI